MKDDRTFRNNREFLKDTLRKQIDFSQTDQWRGVPAPPVQEPFDPASPRIILPGADKWKECVTRPDLLAAITNRVSHRTFTSSPLSLNELSFLLYSTQGIKTMPTPSVSLRTVPSAGARHSFETYLIVRNVEGLKRGLYRYLAVENELLALGELQDLEEKLTKGTLGQRFVSGGAAIFIWACVPYRMEWRYGPAAHRVILMDVGHVCQNLYLACEGIGAGTCAVAAYDQELVDELIRVDGKDQFAVYLAPVGKVGQRQGEGRRE
jgi:SagB-type dehydrogenase family enzyme